MKPNRTITGHVVRSLELRTTQSGIIPEIPPQVEAKTPHSQQEA